MLGLDVIVLPFLWTKHRPPIGSWAGTDGSAGHHPLSCAAVIVRGAWNGQCAVVASRVGGGSSKKMASDRSAEATRIREYQAEYGPRSPGRPTDGAWREARDAGSIRDARAGTPHGVRHLAGSTVAATRVGHARRHRTPPSVCVDQTQLSSVDSLSRIRKLAPT